MFEAIADLKTASETGDFTTITSSCHILASRTAVRLDLDTMQLEVDVKAQTEAAAMGAVEVTFFISSKPFNLEY